MYTSNVVFNCSESLSFVCTLFQYVICASVLHRLENFIPFGVESLNVVSSEIKVRAIQNRFIVTRKTEMLVDHIGGSSFFCAFCSCEFIKIFCVQRLELRIMFPFNTVRRAQFYNILRSLNFSNPRHRIRWMISIKTNVCSKFNCQKLNIDDVGNSSNSHLSFSLYETSYGDILVDSDDE